MYSTRGYTAAIIKAETFYLSVYLIHSEGSNSRAKSYFAWLAVFNNRRGDCNQMVIARYQQVLINGVKYFASFCFFGVKLSRVKSVARARLNYSLNEIEPRVIRRKDRLKRFKIFLHLWM